MARRTTAQRITDRLHEAGIRFPDGPPDAAHSVLRGQERQTWMVYRRVVGGFTQHVPRVKWIYYSDPGATVLSDIGSEILLDLPAAELAKAPCLIAYRREDSPWELHLTELDSWARCRQLSLPARPMIVHWIDRQSSWVGRWCTVRVDGDNWRGIVVSDESGPETGSIDPGLVAPSMESQAIPRLGVRVLCGESSGVSLLRRDEVRLGREITDPS